MVLSIHSKCYLRLIVFPFASRWQIVACGLFSHLTILKKFYKVNILEMGLRYLEEKGINSIYVMYN